MSCCDKDQIINDLRANLKNEERAHAITKELLQTTITSSEDILKYEKRIMERLKEIEPYSVDVGFEEPGHSHVWISPSDVPAYVEKLRDQIRNIKKQHEIEINALKNAHSEIIDKLVSDNQYLRNDLKEMIDNINTLIEKLNDIKGNK